MWRGQSQWQTVVKASVISMPGAEGTLSLGSLALAQVLDAPLFCDDFYRSQLDWGANNVVAVCLGKKVYLWNGADSSVRL